MLATIVSTVQFVITAKAPSSKHSPHCSMETELKFVYAHEAVCVTGDCIYLWAMCRLKLPGAKCHFNPVAASVSLSGAQGQNWPQVLTQAQSHTHQHLGWHIQYFHEVSLQLRVYQKHAMPNLPVVVNQRCSKCILENDRWSHSTESLMSRSILNTTKIIGKYSQRAGTLQIQTTPNTSSES